MSERVQWLPDGTASGAPFSPRFQDRYRAELGGMEQARNVFLAGCGLPAAWAGQARWCILETGFGLGLNFLVSWQAWKADPARPRMLHFVSTEAFPASADDVLRSASAHPELMPLATQLQAQLWGLLPGFHRLVFEDGQLLLTLCIGDARAMLRQQQFEADSVFLDGFSPQVNPDIWDVHTFKAVARCCRRGSRISTWTVARSVLDALAQAGFVVHKTAGVAPKRDNLQGEYNPHWTPKNPPRDLAQKTTPGRCVVIGAGLAGAAVAASLARRGWQVLVLDESDQPAAGASGLPAGLLAPHVSPDDSVLSRLSRCGIRSTVQQAQALLQQDQDWSGIGVLEHGVDPATRKRPKAWTEPWCEAAGQWSTSATPEQMTQAGLPADAPGLWHARGGWIQPARLVQAWLGTPGIRWRGAAKVAQVRPANSVWEVLDSTGEVLARAELVVVAAAYASQSIAERSGQAGLSLQAIRGQVSMASAPQHTGEQKTFPPFAVNGNGSLIPAFPTANGPTWIAGASYERGSQSTQVRMPDHLENLSRLQLLLPRAGAFAAQALKLGGLRGWAGVRCATPGRLPVVQQLAITEGASLWVCTGMGSRGLTFASLCGELLAARLHSEPLPLEQRLAEALELPARPVLVRNKLPE